MNKKGVTTILMIILLTLSMCGLAATTPTVEAATIRVPLNYATIQAAINAANPGDTILVDPGTYPEYVCVNKSIKLLGTNRLSKITGGPGSTTRVLDVKKGSIAFSGNVLISGFTVQGPTLNYKGIYVEPPAYVYFSNINVTDNTVIGCNDGIYYLRSNYCYVTNNTCLRNTYGIRLCDSKYNVVEENFVNASGYYGINFYSYSHYNNMTRNIVAYTRYGVHLEYTSFTYMYLNRIENNTEYGLRISYGSNNTVKGNTIAYNKIGVYIWNCSKHQFYYNNFIMNTNQVTHYDAPLTGNLWDDNPPAPHVPGGAKGNYWSDYTGVDDGSGVGRWGEGRLNGDGVGDTKIPHLQLDWYPLMHPWTPVPPGPAPVAIFTWSPPEPIYNLPATFNASLSYDIDGTIVLYTWNFGDGNTTAVTSPIIEHTFQAFGNFTVKLTVKDNDGLTNSTSHIIRVLEYKLEIDVYTQQDPFNGKGPNQPSDAFAPQSEVILYASVTYNYAPVDNKMVAFEVKSPNGTQYLYREANTNADGIANISFRLASNAPFGNYSVLAQVTVSGHVASDTLMFEVGWIIEILEIKTVDQYGAPKIIFARGEQLYFDVVLKNIAFTSKLARLTVTVYDETNQTIGVADIWLEVPPGTYQYSVIFSVRIPQWSFVGPLATTRVDAFTQDLVPYCPEKSAQFQIIP